MPRNAKNSQPVIGRRTERNSNQPSHFEVSFVGQIAAAGGPDGINIDRTHQAVELGILTEFEAHLVAKRHNKQRGGSHGKNEVSISQNQVSSPKRKAQVGTAKTLEKHVTRKESAEE